MIWNLAVTGDVFEARSGIRKDRGQQIVRSHALNLRRDFLTSLKTQKGERAIGVPAPPSSKNRGIQCSLFQDRLHSFGLQKPEDVREREAMLLRQCNVQAVIRRRRLQLEIETPAKAFAERQSP